MQITERPERSQIIATADRIASRLKVVESAIANLQQERRTLMEDQERNQQACSPHSHKQPGADEHTPGPHFHCPDCKAVALLQ